MFYEVVNRNKNGELGNPGDMHYWCFHGIKQVVTVMKKIKCCLTGESQVSQSVHATGTELYLELTNNLKQTCPSMYHVYLTMKDLSPDEINPEMVSLVSGRIVLDPVALVEWLGKNEAQATAMSISSAFKKQIEAAASPWDQVKFEDMLAKWLVATDQLFSTVDDPKFQDFLTYAHHPAPYLKILHCNAIKRRVMRMYEDTIRATRQMFQASSSYTFIFKLTTALQHEVEGKVSISLNA